MRRPATDRTRFSRPSFDTTCHMQIGEVAHATGASVKAIRLYERRWLIPPPKRRGTYRIYSELHVFLIHVIRHAQGVGFTLAELKSLLGVVAEGRAFPVAEVDAAMDQKATRLDEQIATLQATKARLVEMRAEMHREFGEGNT